MLKDITLFQYFPGESVIHRLDAKTKIMLSMLYIIIVFTVQNFFAYALLAVFTLGVIKLSTVPLKFILKGIKPIMFFMIFTALLNLFMTDGEVVKIYGTPLSWGIFSVTYEGVRFSVFMVLRIMFLVLGTSLLTYTTSPITLTDGIERLLKPFSKIGLPAHEIAMMMSIALRFIPSLLEETDKIMKAQMARGADFTSGSLVKRAKALLPMLVPLFISSFKRADELAVAMESRCYHGGDGRTKLHVAKITVLDIYAYIVLALFGIAVMALNIFM